MSVIEAHEVVLHVAVCVVGFLACLWHDKLLIKNKQ